MMTNLKSLLLIGGLVFAFGVGPVLADDINSTVRTTPESANDGTIDSTHRSPAATTANQGNIDSTQRAPGDPNAGSMGSMFRSPADTVDSNAGNIDSTHRGAAGITNAGSIESMHRKPVPKKADPNAVDPAVCRALVNATPDADVAYEPGVSAEGDKVAPADLAGSSQLPLPDKINIPLTLNLAKSLNVNANSYPYNQFGQGTEPELGMLTVEGNNVSLNGKPLSDAQQDKLAVLCLHPKN